MLTGYRQVFPCVTLDICTHYSFSSQSNLFRVWSKLFNCAGINNYTLFSVGGLKPRSIFESFIWKFESFFHLCPSSPSLPCTSRAGREGWKYLSPAETCLSPLKGASVTQPFSTVPFSNEAAPLTHLRRLEPLSYFNIVNCNPFGWPFGFGDMGWFFRCTTIYNPQTRFDENAFWWTLTSKRLFLWHIMISTCWKQCRSKWISRIDLCGQQISRVNISAGKKSHNQSLTQVSNRCLHSLLPASSKAVNWSARLNFLKTE